MEKIEKFSIEDVAHATLSLILIVSFSFSGFFTIVSLEIGFVFFIIFVSCFVVNYRIWVLKWAE